MRRYRWVAVSLFAFASACGKSPTGPAAPDGPGVLPDAAGRVSATSGNPPVGEFRINPAPGPDDVVRTVVGTPVRINGAHFADPEGDGLVLRADWGDQHATSAPCGPCRLQHAYRAGSYAVTATLADGTNEVTRTFRVVVEPATRCTPVYQNGGSGTGIIIGPAGLGIQAGDEIIAELNGPGQLVDTRIHLNGVYYYASFDLNGGAFFPDSVRYSLVAPTDAVGGADFNGAGGLPYSWSLTVQRCGVVSASSRRPPADSGQPRPHPLW